MEEEGQCEALRVAARVGGEGEGVRLRLRVPEVEPLRAALAEAQAEACWVPESVAEGLCKGVAEVAAERAAEAESEGEGVKVGRGQSAKTEPGLPADVAQEVPAAPPSEKRRKEAFLPSVTLRQ